MHDTSIDGNTFDFRTGDSFVIHVFAKDNVDCYEFDLSISDDTFEYFDRICDDLYSNSEYTYLGDLLVDETGQYQIVADGDIIIVNANEVGTGGLISIVSCGCCMIGLILLIVGLATGKSKPQVIMMQPDGSIIAVSGQQVMQQPLINQTIPETYTTNQPEPVQQAQETSVQSYNFEHKEKP